MLREDGGPRGKAGGSGDTGALTMVGAVGAPQRGCEMGRNTGRAGGQLVLLAGQHDPPDRGRSDDKNIISSDGHNTPAEARP